MLAAALAGAFPFTVEAAGLGRLTVLSALGQPLRAEVEVSASREELNSLTARIAAPEAFKQAGIEFSPILTGVKVSLDKKPNGQSVIRIASDRPISEPFLDMLLEVSWASGRLVREYTFLLDPPEVAGRQQIAPVVVPESQSPPPAKAAPKAREPVAESPAAPAPAGGQREIKRGDTLGKIAAETKPEGVSLDQMLVALFRGNPDAFDGKNMNRLRAGRILSVPDRDTVTAVTPGEARKVIVAQAADFDAYRKHLAGAAEAGPAAPGEAPKQTAAGKIAPQVKEAAPPPTEGKDQLRVSKSEADKQAKAADKRVAVLEEDVVAKDKALKEANSRLSDLEKNVKELQRLLELKNQSLADLQKQAAMPGVPAPVAKFDSPKVEPVKPAEPAKSAEPQKAAEPPKAEEPKPAAVPAPVKPAEPPAAAPPKPVAKPTKAAEPPPEPGIVDALLDNPTALVGGGGVLALLLGLVAYRIRRNQAPAAPTTTGAATTTTGTHSVFGRSGGQSVDTSSSSIQTDFSQSGMAAIDADEGVDPVAEADVYMAYGRDAQAEEILLDALKNEPARHAIHLKLLEIYAQRKNGKQFETIASELFAQTNGAGADWEKAAALGRKLDPANPLFAAKETKPEPAPAAGALAAGAVAAATVAASSDAQAAAVSGLSGGAAPDLELPAISDAGEETPAELETGTQYRSTWAMPGEFGQAAADAVVEGAAPASLDFELDIGGGGSGGAQPDDLGLDLDLGLDGEGAKDDARTVAMGGGTAAPVVDIERTDVGGGSLDFHLGTDAGMPPAVEQVEVMDIERTDIALGGSDIAANIARAGSVVDLERTDVGTNVLDFSLQAPAPASVPAAAPAGGALDLERTDITSSVLDFNLNLGDDGLSGEAPSIDLERTEIEASSLDDALAARAPAATIAGDSVDLERTEIVASALDDVLAAPAADTLSPAGVDLSAINLDLDVPAEGDPEVDTKLELAQAYEEMGDREGARELLDEVLGEGNAAQKQKAQDLLARLA